MDHQSAGVDFALIGHQDSWKKITAFAKYLSINGHPVTEEKIAEVYSFIPPRKLFDIEVKSLTGQTVTGCYIETFISPAELELRHWKKNLLRVKEAANCAKQMNAGIAGLGGFTSIVLEGRDNTLNENSTTCFTTGNTLTAAFIVKAIEKACMRFDKDLQEQKVLVIGATGDIGSACVRYFAGKVKEILLCARQATALNAFKDDLNSKGYAARASTDLTLLPEADIIIAIASSTIEDFNPALCKEDVIICDAGYPKNLIANFSAFADRLFCGGMGTVAGGYCFTPAIHHTLYDFPVANTGYACLLEAVILALEENFQAYSTGKGKITIEKMEWIYAAANKHGITEAPFFNPLYAWPLKQNNEKAN